jgi:hypothetical protein
MTKSFNKTKKTKEGRGACSPSRRAHETTGTEKSKKVIERFLSLCSDDRRFLKAKFVAMRAGGAFF